MQKAFRTIIRNHVFKMLYQYEQLGDDYNDIPKVYWLYEDEVKDKKLIKYANELFINIAKNKEFLDNLYKKKLKEGWSFERLGIIEKCILRAAVYELLNTKTPIYTINNDYGNIAKEYASDQIVPFIIGVVSSIEKDNRENKT